MPNPTELIEQALSKKASVSQAASAKVANFTSQDAYNAAAGQATDTAGIVSATPVEQDIRTLNPSQLYGKYGSRASDLLATQVQGDMAFSRDASGNRTFAGAAGDVVTGVGAGAVNSLGGIAALGAGVIDEDAGAWASGMLDDFNTWGQGMQSEALQNRRRANAARNLNNKRDNAKQFDEDKLTDGNLMATLKREGRNALDVVKNAVDDPMMLSDGTAQGVGSMVAGLPLARAGAAAGIGAGASMPIAIGAMEGGGAYSQTNQEVQKMTHAQLMESSPAYRDALDSGLSREQARNRVANRSALIAAAIQAPVGVATGKLVSKFEGSPLSSGSLKQTLGNLVKETVEEGTQSITGQIAQNVGQRLVSDQSKDLGEGVGEQAGLGALYGLGTAGAVQAPATAVNITQAAGKATWQGAKAIAGASSDALRNQADKLQKANEKASPLADAAVQATAETVVAEPAEVSANISKAIDETNATPEQKTQANDFVNAARDSFKFDAATVDTNGWTEADKASISGSTNRIAAVNELAERVYTTTGQDQLLAAGALYQVLQPMVNLQKADPEALQSIPADHEARKVLDMYSQLLANVENTPSIRKALKQIDELVQQQNAGVPDIKVEQLNTAEGVGVAKAAVAVASLHPNKGNLATNELILKHAVEGKLVLTPSEKAALQTSISLLRAERTVNEEKARLNLQTKSDLVSDQIITRDSVDQVAKSALQHTKDIVSAMRANNTELASAWMDDFGKFVEHMQNKVNALNEHLATGNPNAPGIRYQQLQPNAKRSWKLSKDGMSIRTGKPTSIQFAQTVALETQVLTDVFNGLVDAFPELKQPQQKFAPLDALLQGDANEIAADFRANRRTALAPTKPAVEPVVQQTQQESAPVKEPVAEVVKPEVVEAKPEPTKEVIAPEPVVEKAAVVTEAIEQAVEETPPAKPINAMDALFPNLVNHVENMFKRAFKIPAEAKTRTIGTETPLQTIKSALSSNAQLSSFLGSSAANTLDSEIVAAYKDLFAQGEALAETMNENLQTFLNNKNVGTRFAQGTEAHRWLDGKALNITEQEGDGYAYNTELLESAVLAGLQWAIDAAQLESIMDDSDISAMTGIAEDRLDQQLINKLNVGMSLAQAKRTLASKIAKYWGVTAQRNQDLAYSEGIPEAVAAEFLRALEKSGILTIETTELTEADGLVRTDLNKEAFKTVERYIVNRVNEDNAIHSFPDAIEQAVMIEPEGVMYFGEDRPPVAKAQMNNADVALTPDQVQAIKNEQETPYYVDTHMVSFFNAFGVDNLMALFGAGDTENRALNVNHKASMEGQNRGVVAAFQQIQNVMANLKNRAGDAIESMPIRYGYAISRVGRMQMLGKYNPQANKLMREAFLPTWSTLDLSTNGDHAKAFSLALGQAFGVKVHNITPEATNQKVQGMLTGALEPAVSLVNDWMATNTTNENVTMSPADMETIRASFKAAGADLTVHALHGLVEYVRLQRSEDKSAFRTSLYLEADGVTNGPINAMMLMTPGTFDMNWLTNVAKGGMSFGGAKTMNEHRAADPVDLYQTSTVNAMGRLMGNLKTLEATNRENPIVQMSRELLSVMDLFMPDVKFDPEKTFNEDALELARGVAKNPLTITLYGSGVDGIAGKYVQQIAQAIYEKLSLVTEAQAKDSNVNVAETMFPGDPDAEKKYTRYVDGIEALTKWEVRQGKEGQYVTASTATPNKKLDPVNFTFSPSELKAMATNMKEIFVKPMRQGIEDTVGHGLMEAVGQLRTATQVQSIFLKYAFQDAIESAVAQKANDPTWKKGDFLSPDEITAINKKLAKSFPLVQTNDQSFLVAKSASLDVEKNAYSRALDGTMRTAANVYAPDAAGVAGIPFLTIGMGDGKMMQTLAQDKAVANTLKIFDGMNMPLDKISEYSQKANAAVYESWKGNPLRAVSEAYNKAMPAMSVEGIPDAMRKDLIKVLFTPAEVKNGVSDEELTTAIKIAGVAVQSAADSIDQRHKVIDSMAASVDQMAAAGAPFVNGNQAFAVAPTTAEVLAELQKRQSQGVQNKPAEVKATPEPKQEKQSNGFGVYGREHKTGVQILSFSSLKQILAGQAPNARTQVMGEIIRSLGTKEYKTVVGSMEQIRAYQEQTGKQALTEMPAGDLNGYISVGDKTIYLVNPSMETLVHELVHASSFETVLSHYEGEQTQPGVADAIGRIERLMLSFTDMETENMNADQKLAFDNAQAAISAAQDNPSLTAAVSKAQALNEFMAWALTNEQITAKLKTVTAPKLVQLAKDVFKAIKQLIWGKKKALPAADDFLSNLQFNAGVVIRSQATLAKQVRDGVLFSNAAYGNNDRLSRVREAFASKISDHFSSLVQTSSNSKQNVNTSAALITADVTRTAEANGFNMNAQESSTFRMIVAALATETQIDPNALAQAQELYAHVTKNLSVESFMADPDSLQPQDRYYAEQKYNVILGKVGLRKDPQGRSTLLPVFLALATVSEQLRSILAKMPVPKTEKNKEQTIDALLENIGNTAMDSLSTRLSGQGKATNVQQAIDNLQAHIQEVVADDQTVYDQFATKSGGIIDRANDVVVGGVEKLSDKGMQFGKKLEASNSKVARASGKFVTAVSGMATEKNGELVAQSVISMMNKTKAWTPFREFVGDLVGRTSENANVYDMIKHTRAMIQQLRQQFRESVPRIIADKFTREVTNEEWTSLYHSMGKTDLASLTGTMNKDEILNLFTDPKALAAAIKKLETSIRGTDATHFNLHQAKMKQLAEFMNTGVAGKNLLRNAVAVSRLFGEQTRRGFINPTLETVGEMDQLITLYAIEGLNQKDKTVLSSLVQEKQTEGLGFTLDYLTGQRKTEQDKATRPIALINHYKGHVPSSQQGNVSLVIAHDASFNELAQQSYKRVADYAGSSIDGGRGKMGYYFAPVNARAAFSQGILQNVRQTVSGVDENTGFTMDMVAGRITDRTEVARLAARLRTEGSTKEPLMPVYGEDGSVMAFERAIDPVQLERLNKNTHLAQQIGVWRGRQVEERKAEEVNQALISNLHSMYEKDMAVSSKNQEQYINLLGTTKDAVTMDAVRLFTNDTIAMAEDKFGRDQFWVRKDMLNDAIGYRTATVGDVWTGNTRWSAQTQEAVKRLAMSVFGNDAYRHMVNTERVIKNFMSDARTTIVVKSVIVPFSNFVSNILQLINRGVPVGNIVKGMPAKLAEIEHYTKSRMRQIEVEAELRAAVSDPMKERKLRVEIRSITDSHKRMSIWPLIEAGEFSTIADVGMTHEDVELTSGKLVSFIEQQVDKLPKSIQTIGKYGLITRDTALFQGLQKSVQYGDFLGKAVMFDDLTKRKGMTPEQALARITEEFVNYDRLTGRGRGYLENVGLLWFYNFKIRAAKVGLSMLRNNPVHSLIAAAIPLPNSFGAGTPIDDNIITKGLEGNLGYSMGPGQGLHGLGLNPWYNLAN